jgi:hypothetical protein
MRRLLPFAIAVLFAATFVGACNQTTINTPVRVFDRPSDVALACRQINIGAGYVFDARSIGDCSPERIQSNSPTDPSTKTTYTPSNYFTGPVLDALVVQSARGELASVDVSAERVIDLRPATPGFGFLPVGNLPEHVRVSDDGCVAVTANTDSCDVATVDLPTLYNMPFLPFRDGGVPAGFGDNVVRRLTPTINGRAIGAQPSWIEFAPDTLPALRGWETDATKHTGTPGQCTERHAFVQVSPPPALPEVQSLPSTYHAWMALPNCQLVVELDVSAQVGNPDGFTPAPVIKAIQVTKSGAQVVSDLSTLSCPTECVGGGPAAPIPDGGPMAIPDGGIVGAGDGGGSGAPDGGTSQLPTTQAQPATIAIDTEGGFGRVFIGDRAGESITILPFDVTSGVLGTPRQLTLAENAIGVQVIRISPRSEAGKFLYAIARDGTVRVIDLDREVECETNPDPRALQDVPDPSPQPGARRIGCFPLGDPATPPRSALAISPGITLPGLALPKDIAFIHTDVPQASATNVAPPTAGPSTLVGDFAWIIGSDGRASAVNIYDACPAPNQPQQLSSNTFTAACDVTNNAAISRATAFGYQPNNMGTVVPGYFGHPIPMELDRVSHRLRGGTNRFFQPVNFSDNAGQPRLADEGNPYQLTVAGLPKSNSGVEQFPSITEHAVPPPDIVPPPNFMNFVPVQHAINFFDPDHVRNETWNLLWEGAIPGTKRTLGAVETHGTTGTLLDGGGSYCTHGVLAGDKLVFPGCVQDSDCSYLESCVQDPDAPLDVTLGMCIAKSRKIGNMTINQTQIKEECSPFLRSLRRYRILSAKQQVPVDPSTDASGITDKLEFAEIYQPEHAIETHTCDLTLGDAQCADVKVTGPSGNPFELTTSCLIDSDGVGRCLRACDPKQPNQCGTDYLCMTSAFNDGRCLLAPLFDRDNNRDLFTDCMPDLKTYEIHTGDSFAVIGSATGFFSDLQANPQTRECEVPPVSSEFIRLRQARVPITPGLTCPDALGPNGNPLAFMPNDLIDPTTGRAAAACLITDTDGRHIHFENPFFAIDVKIPPAICGGASPAPSTMPSESPEPSPSPAPTSCSVSGLEVPPDQLTLSFNLVGSGFPLQVILAVDVQAQQPRSVAVAPDRETVFVVDEGKQTTATGLFGQLLKLSSNAVAVDRSFTIR